jgi:hypothetical protein
MKSPFMPISVTVLNDIITVFMERHKQYISLVEPAGMNVFQKHTSTPLELLLNWEVTL